MLNVMAQKGAEKAVSHVFKRVVFVKNIASNFENWHQPLVSEKTFITTLEAEFPL